jgi:hypothetical protein
MIANPRNQAKTSIYSNPTTIVRPESSLSPGPTSLLIFSSPAHRKLNRRPEHSIPTQLSS